MENVKEYAEGNRFFGLENKLAESLRPVRPNPAFINSLKGKLTKGRTIILEHRDDYLGFVAIGLGLAIGAMIIILAKRSK
jgi:hypothetical protein